MSKNNHIDNILRKWDYDPINLTVRIVQAGDDREVIQMRIDMGILQLEMSGRPDGSRPEGSNTILEHLRALDTLEGEDWELSDQQCLEVDREFVQFYHRRICWLKLKEYALAVRDADHSLALMDVCRDHSPDEQWKLSHEQYRPFIQFHRTQAAAFWKLDDVGPQTAIDTINDGLETMRDQFMEMDDEIQFNDDELVKRLIELRESFREQYEQNPTIHEQLQAAIDNEKYELAAKIRDAISRGEIELDS